MTTQTKTMNVMTAEQADAMRAHVIAEVEAKLGRALLPATTELMGGFRDMVAAGADPLAVIAAVTTALTSGDDTDDILARLADDLATALPIAEERH